MSRRKVNSVELKPVVGDFAFSPDEKRQELVREQKLILAEMSRRGGKDWLTIFRQAKRILVVGPSVYAPELEFFTTRSSFDQNQVLSLLPHIEQLVLVDEDSSIDIANPWNLLAFLSSLSSLRIHNLTLDQYTVEHVKQKLAPFDLITFFRAEWLTKGSQIPMEQCLANLLSPSGYAMLSGSFRQIEILQSQAIRQGMQIEQAPTSLFNDSFFSFGTHHVGLVLRQSSVCR